MNIINTLKEENRQLNLKYSLFIFIGIVLQIIGFFASEGNSILSLISGCFGVIAVVYTSLKKLSAYIPAFIQLGTYMILAWRERFYGELGENIFYLITMIAGVFIWIKGYDKTNNIVKSRSLKSKNISLLLFTLVGIIILWFILSKTNDSQPLMDSITTVPAFVDQILMILRYREQWIYWIIIDIASIVMWWKAGDFCMVAQFVFWTLNCLLGWKLWRD